MKGIILAGGQSVRMGRDKALLTAGGQTLIDRIYESLEVQVNTVAISGSQTYGLDIPLIRDAPKGPKGPAAALYAAWLLRETDSGAGVFTVPIDTPNIPPDLCERLYGDQSAIAVTPSRTHQACGWWLYQDLSRLFAQMDVSQSLSLHRTAQICKARHVLWADEALFYNINTPEDLERFTKDSVIADHRG